LLVLMVMLAVPSSPTGIPPSSLRNAYSMLVVVGGDALETAMLAIKVRPAIHLYMFGP